MTLSIEAPEGGEEIADALAEARFERVIEAA